MWDHNRLCWCGSGTRYRRCHLNHPHDGEWKHELVERYSFGDVSDATGTFGVEITDWQRSLVESASLTLVVTDAAIATLARGGVTLTDLKTTVADLEAALAALPIPPRVARPPALRAVVVEAEITIVAGLLDMQRWREKLAGANTRAALFPPQAFLTPASFEFEGNAFDGIVALTPLLSRWLDNEPDAATRRAMMRHNLHHELGHALGLRPEGDIPCADAATVMQVELLTDAVSFSLLKATTDLDISIFVYMAQALRDRGIPYPTAEDIERLALEVIANA